MSENGKSEIGLIGLAVMGQNLALNIADHGFQISVYNRTTSKMEDFVAKHPETPGGLVGDPTLDGFVQSLKRPRKIIIQPPAIPATQHSIPPIKVTPYLILPRIKVTPYLILYLILRLLGEGANMEASHGCDSPQTCQPASLRPLHTCRAVNLQA